MILAPGGTIGILGGGQLGRMLGIAAAQLGYRTHIYAPEASGPATEVAAEWTQATFDDPAALEAFSRTVDVATYEFENVNPYFVARLSGQVPVRPSAFSLDIAGYRPNEKDIACKLGGRTAPYRHVKSVDELRSAIDEIGSSSILKTSAMGYDGKGQVRIAALDDAEAAWAAVGSQDCVLEGFVRFSAEFSVILCRAADGQIVVWDTPENRHVKGILDRSMIPANDQILAQSEEAVELSMKIAERLGHIGVLTCEFFATADGPVFNEMAPRVHNSGHWTIEGARTSQFENHIRAVCGLPLGSTERTGARVEMRNLIGDAADEWPAILQDPAAKLHLYGKTIRAGRKMGHVTRID